MLICMAIEIEDSDDVEVSDGDEVSFYHLMRHNKLIMTSHKLKSIWPLHLFVLGLYF